MSSPPPGSGRRVPSTPRSRKRESGQITVMLVLLALCLLLGIAAVTDISAAYLRRQSATSLADGAALSVSDAAAASGVYGGGDDDYVTMDQVTATAAVDAYLSQIDAYADFPGLAIRVSVAGHTVTVSLTMPFQLPIAIPGTTDAALIHASSASVLPIY